jgi:RNA polymerase sigma-70 factor, ECF subfamily
MPESLWPEPTKTQNLLAAAREGQPSAINALLDGHRNALHRMVALRLDQKVQRRVDVSDVVQEVLVEASGRLEKYLANPEMAFSLWLRQIATDHIIDTYRRHRVSAKRSMDREQPIAAAGTPDQSSIDLAFQLTDPLPTPGAIAAQREIAKQVEGVIEQLNDQDREVLLLRHYEHLSNQEIADALGLSGPAASMRYLRAIRRLREMLSDQSLSDQSLGDQSLGGQSLGGQSLGGQSLGDRRANNDDG